ncbi:hypothetical protein GW17_00005686 [Ensete ventricosum]|nr:hypothetical protein GW17_00005686 [Ensete ventricosum]
MSETCESRKPNLCRKKSTMTKAQGKMCLRCMSRKNLTRIRKNSSQRNAQEKIYLRCVC